MGFYINHPEMNSLGKVDFIVSNLGGEIIPQPETLQDIPEDKALIVVVNNGMFEAAGYAFDQGEFESFTWERNKRPKVFVQMDKQQAEKLSGYKSFSS